MPTLWAVRGRVMMIDRPIVVGIVNVTPDSFSDGGQFTSVGDAVRHAERLVDDGADVIDLGGESTRPGAAPVRVDEELERILPVVREVRRGMPEAILSVDTTKAAVAEAVLSEGVDVINDVSAFRLDPDMAEVCARARAGVVLMHSRGGAGELASYAHAQYENVTTEVLDELEARVREAEEAGMSRDAICIDPGLGFSKRSEHSLRLLAELPRLRAMGLPILVGASRKRFVGEIVDARRSTTRSAAERDAGTTGAHVAALGLGARLFRVHDVRLARQALDVAWAVMTAGMTPA